MMRGAVAVLCAAAIAGPVSSGVYTGVVYGPDSVPLAGVVVTDLATGQSDTTGPDGVFAVGGSCLVSVVPERYQARAGVEAAGPWYDLAGRMAGVQSAFHVPRAGVAGVVNSGGAISPGLYVARRDRSGPSGRVGASTILAKAMVCTGDTLLFVLDSYVTQRVFAADTATAVRVYMAQGGIRDVSAAEAYALVSANGGSPRFVIVDIRTPGEYAAGHLAGALNIDYYSADFAQQLGRLDRTVTHLVYCRSGGRSTAAMTTFANLGFQLVYNLFGGYTAWVGAGYPVVQ